MMHIFRDFYAAPAYNIGMKILSCAKVNLTLDVLGKRPDGYHELSTVMCSVDLCDTLTADFDFDGADIAFEPPLPETNAARRAALEYMRRARTPGIRARIVRAIPEEAGLGGSSADAAAVLRAMQAHYNALPEDALFELAASVGADVPFMMRGGTALCRGKGELIEPLPPMALDLLIVKPARGISTKALFSRLEPPYEAPKSGRAAEALRSGDKAALLSSVSNALYQTACTIAPQTASIVARMLAAGAEAASMTGSGSAAFGIFPSATAAKKALAAFEGEPFARVCTTGHNML